MLIFLYFSRVVNVSLSRVILYSFYYNYNDYNTIRLSSSGMPSGSWLPKSHDRQTLGTISKGQAVSE